MKEKTIEEIIKNNQGLIYSIINKYTNYYDKEDLYQVSIIGIIKAYNNYQENLNTKFTTYAYKWILSEVINFVNNSNTIKTGRKYNALYKKILEAKNILTQRLMKEPTEKELALFLELDESLITDIIKLKKSVESLDKTICEDGKTLTLLDSIEEKKYLHDYDEIDLKEGLSYLSEQEQKLIELRYFQEKTQTETAKYFNTNQVQISRNEQKILKKLKKTICETV